MQETLVYIGEEGTPLAVHRREKAGKQKQCSNLRLVNSITIVRNPRQQEAKQHSGVSTFGLGKGS